MGRAARQDLVHFTLGTEHAMKMNRFCLTLAVLFGMLAICLAQTAVVEVNKGTTSAAAVAPVVGATAVTQTQVRLHHPQCA